MPDEIELLRQQTLHIAARIGALETIMRILFALICSYDNSPDMRQKLEHGIFPLMLQEVQEKDYPNTPKELRNWIVDQEATILRNEFAQILSAIDQLRSKAGGTPS